MLRHKYRGWRFDLVVGQDPARHDHVVDKRIIPRFVRYERRDLCIGIALVMIGAFAMISVPRLVLARIVMLAAK